MRTSVSTIIIDPRHLFRAGLEHLLKKSDYRVIASCGDLVELPDLRLTPSRTALFILSIEEITRKGGQPLRDIKGKYPGARIVVMGETFAGHVPLAIQSGADACLLTTITLAVLVRSLDVIMLGGKVFSEGLRLFSDEAPPSGRLSVGPEEKPRTRLELSKREVQILSSITEGQSNKVIALRYCLTESTVKAHMKAILRKIGVANRTQAAMWARDQDMLSQLTAAAPTLGEVLGSAEWPIAPPIRT